MNIYTYRYDATCTKIVADNQSEADDILMNKFKSVQKLDDRLFQHWDASLKEEINVTCESISKGIISHVAH